MKNIDLYTMENGLTIIDISLASTETVALNVLIGSGARHETKDLNGVAHFLEHMMFKGTKKRETALEIASELDGLGARSGAYTSYEYTGLFAHASTQATDQLIEILGDVYINSTLPREEIEKEKGVILDEIDMYQDDPQSVASDVLRDMIFGDQPIGRDILGTKENITNINKDDLEVFRDRHYHAKNTVVALCGSHDQSTLESIKTVFSDCPQADKMSPVKYQSKNNGLEVRVTPQSTKQSHLVLGWPTLQLGSSQEPILRLLAAIIGQGMSSRLFEKIRNQLGISYYVGAGYQPFTDCGVFSIATGVNPNMISKTIKAILEECHKLKDEVVSQAELNKARQYLVGNMYISLESSALLSRFLATGYILRNKIFTPANRELELESVTAQDIQKLSQDLFTKDSLKISIVTESDNHKLAEEDIASIIEL